MKEGILDALGGPTTVREVAFVSEEDWQELATTLTVNPEPIHPQPFKGSVLVPDLARG